MGIQSRSAQLVSFVVLALAGTLSAYRATCAASEPPEESAAVALTDADSYAAVRQEFRAAYARAITGETDSNDDSAALKAYPIYRYLVAARIRRALSGPSESLALADERAANFIAAHSREPVARGLRRAWLESLASRERWDPFLEAYSEREANDALRCDDLDARIASAPHEDVPSATSDRLARAVERAWLIQRNVPECEPAFAWLKRTGRVTVELIEQRARLDLADGHATSARVSVLELPPNRAGPLFQWVSLLESPRRSIDALIASPDTPVEPAALLAGWTLLARAEPDAAVARYESLVRARGLNRDSASPYALALALALAWGRDGAALDYFGRVRAADLDDEAIAWRVRAALWSGDWAQTAQALAALSDGERQLPRWRYWAARSAEQLGHAAVARELYESVLTDGGYYSVMAAARLHRPFMPHPEAVPVDRKTLEALERAPAFVRARELFLCGLRGEAPAEWHLGYESLGAPERLQAIHLAASWGWYDQSVAAATAEHVFNDYTLLYPRPYDAAVSEATQLSGLTPDVIYGVVRRESLYRTDAVSSAGARGLMQLELGTARITARYWKLRRPRLGDLFDPYVNTSLGAERLRMLLDRFGGQLPVALAGYDAGVNAATRWLPSRPVDADIWIENIPYNETREYVEHVLWNSLLFSWLRTGGEPQPSDAWVATIETPTREANVAPVGLRSGRR
ncbi:MAG TPA: transglycosylase SLT domain-containing protein [Steroidobacteraceae bacterium]|nr:transglycosylase SLT domain-containing protein [Steroidobacteraceae bacterium]